MSSNIPTEIPTDENLFYVIRNTDYGPLFQLSEKHRIEFALLGPDVQVDFQIGTNGKDGAFSLTNKIGTDDYIDSAEIMVSGGALVAVQVDSGLSKNPAALLRIRATRQG